MASLMMFNGVALAVDSPTTANDSTTVSSTNQLTTKNYVDSGLRAVNAKAVAAQTDASTALDEIGDMNELTILVDDGNGGTVVAPDLVTAIEAVADMADDAAQAAQNANNTYDAGLGVDITNNTIQLDGLTNSSNTDNKTYIYKNGQFREMDVVNDWMDSALN